MCVYTGGLSPMRMGNAKIIIKYFCYHCKKKGLCEKSKLWKTFLGFIFPSRTISNPLELFPELPELLRTPALKKQPKTGKKPLFRVFFTTFLFGFFQDFSTSFFYLLPCFSPLVENFVHRTTQKKSKKVFKSTGLFTPL